MLNGIRNVYNFARGTVARKIGLWMKELGVKEVTMYAFAVENFRRPKKEVDGVMRLISKTLEEDLRRNKR